MRERESPDIGDRRKVVRIPLPTPALKAEAASATPLFARFQGRDTQETAHGESHGHQHTT